MEVKVADFKDHYVTLGLERNATQDVVKRAYRKLARKFHPDVSKEPDAEARFKEVAQAHEALIDPERRAAYDAQAMRHARGEGEFAPADGGGTDGGFDPGFDFSRAGRASRSNGGAADGEFDDFFSSLFGQEAARDRGRAGGRHGDFRAGRQASGGDHHAKVEIDLEDSYHGAQRSITWRMPAFDAHGQVGLTERRLEVNIPRGMRQGQHLRLAGQGDPGHDGVPAGDLYLEITLRPHRLYRVDGRDVFVDLPITPWEAALGAEVTAPTPEGPVQLTIPAGSTAGRKLRLKGKGVPGKPAGDLYAVLVIALPPAVSDTARAAYAALASASADFNPRAALESP